MGRRPWWLTGLVGLGGLLGGSLLAGGAGLLWLRTPSGSAWAEQQVLGALNGSVPGELSLGALDLRLPRGLEAKQLKFASEDGSPLLEVGSLLVRLEPRRLLAGELHIVSLQLEDVQVHLAKGPAGQLDLLDALGVSPPDPAALPAPSVPWSGLGAFSVRVEEVGLHQVALSYHDATETPEAPTHVVLTDGSLEAAIAAVGARVEVSRLRVDAELVSPVKTPLAVDAAAVFDAGTLVLSALDLRVGSTTLGVQGSVHALETDPVLALEIELPRLDPAEVNRLAGQAVLAEPLGLQGAVRGPLDALEATAAVSGSSSGAVDLYAEADLHAEPLDWRLALKTARFDLQPLLPAVTEPVVISGDWVVDGEGTAWPDGLAADVTITSTGPVLWGEPLESLSLQGRLEDGHLTVTRFSSQHALGSLVAEGEVDLGASTLRAVVTAGMPRLSALDRFGVRGAGGRAEFSGSAEMRWAAEPLWADVSGRLVGADLGLEEAELQVSRAVVPLVAQIRGSRVEAWGSLVAQSLLHPSAAVETVAASRWTATMADRGAVFAAADLQATGLDLGGGAVALEGLAGVLSGGVDDSGVPFAEAAVLLSALRLGNSGLSAEGGPAVLQVGADQLAVSLDLSRAGRPFLGGEVGGDLATGVWSIDELVLAPVLDAPWRAQGPVRFRLVEDGVQDLEAHLVSSGGALRVSGDWMGPAASETMLTLRGEALELGAIAALAAAYQPTEDGLPSALSGLVGVLDLEAELMGESSEQGASATLDVEVRDLGVPGMIDNAHVELLVEGPLAEPRLSMEVGPSGGEPLVRLEGAAPLALVEGLPAGVACGTPASLRFLVLPGELSALEDLFGEVGFPEGRASLELRASQDVCNPEIAVTGAAEVEVGLRGERLRFDLEGGRHGGALHVRAELEEKLARRLTLDLDLETHLEAVLSALLAPPDAADLEATPIDTGRLSTWVETLDLRVVPLELPLSTLGRLTRLPPTLSGVVGGGVHLRGAPSSPVVEGALLLVDGQVGTTAVEQAEITLVPQATPGDYRVSVVSSFGRQGAEGGVEVMGQVPLALDLDASEPLALDREGLDLQMRGEGLPLGLLVGLVEGVTAAEGQLRVSGSATGSLARPAFNLRAELLGGSLVAEGLGVQFRDLDLLAQATPELLDLRRFQASSAPLFGLRTDSEDRFGTLSLLGRITLEGLQPARFNLDLSAERFWLSANDDLRLAVDADLALRGQAPRLALRGDARLVTGEVSIGQDFFAEGSSLDLDTVLTIHRKRALDRQQQRVDNSLLNTMTVDLDLDLHSGLTLLATVPTSVDYGEQFAELSSVGVSVLLLSPEPLRLEMQGGDRQLFGGLEATRGDLNIMGKGFSVISGSTLGFNGDLTDPTLAIEAVHRTAQHGDIEVDVGGSVSALELEFASSEYPDPTDVMSILVLGKPPSALSEAEGQMGGALLGAALGSVANSLTRAVSGAFFGRLEIDGDSFRMGVPVSNSVFATMEVRSTDEEDENSLEMTLEWLLSSHMSAELVTGNQAATSADVYYRWRF